MFVVRVHASAPTIWQRAGDRLKMLCRLFPPFDDAFCCLQEWELNTQTHQQQVRLDFLHKIVMPSSTRYESPSFFSKYRAATLGGHNYAINKEIQRYHVVNQLYTDQEMQSILNGFSFFQTAANPQLMAALEELTPTPLPVRPPVLVAEKADEPTPTALVSVELSETDSEGNLFYPIYISLF